MKTKVYMLILLGVLMIASGCDRYIESENPVRSLPDALEAPVNVTVMLDDQAVTLAWEMTDSSDVARFRVYVADTADAEFVLRDSSVIYTCTVENLAVNRTYRFTVAAIDSDGFEGLRSAPVTARVGVMSIAIEGNAEYTNTRNVRIQLNAIIGTTHVRLSEDSLFSDAVFESFAAFKDFTLSPGDGEKTVYGQYIFSDGSRSGQPLSDKIVLDTRVNIEAVSFSPVGPFATGDTITFEVNAGEIDGEASVVFAGRPPVILYDDGADADASADDGIYTARFVVPNDLVVTDGLVTGHFIDAAGNSAQRPAAQTLSIQSTPLPVQLIAVETINSYELSLSWTQAASSDFQSYRIYRELTDAVDEDSRLVATITSRSTTVFVDTALNESTMYYYRVYVQNNFGLTAGSNIDSGLTDINEPPLPVVLAGRIVSDSAIELSWSRNGDVDFDSYRVYRDTVALGDPPTTGLLQVINNRTTDSFTDYAPGSAAYHYRVYVYDRQGRYAASNEVVVSR